MLLTSLNFNLVGFISISILYMVINHGKVSSEVGENNSNQVRTENGNCYSDDPEPFVHFSSKTAYRAIYNESEYDPPPENCQPKSLWFLGRHGIRYAVTEPMRNFQQLAKLRDNITYNHEELKQGSLCKKDVENLKKWKWLNISSTESDHLTPEGYVELVHQARRYRSRFPDIFRQEFSKHLYLFQHTAHLKNRRSAIAYADGIFGSKITEEKRNEVCPMPSSADLLVQLNPDCKDDILHDDEMSGFLHSKKWFRNGQHMKTVVEEVSERLGFEKPLTQKTVEDIYNLCRYSKAWYYNDLSPWCACFSKKDLMVFEYMNDLAYYYNAGPGMEVNKRFGCPLLQDMLLLFKGIKEDESKPHYLAKFYFGHSTTLFNLLAQLGTHKQDEHITVDNYAKMHDRLWKTSIIDPFGSNFVAVFLKCDSDDPYRIMFYLNEMNFRIKECGGNTCSWDKFFNIHKDVMDPKICNTEYCEELDEKFLKWLDEDLDDNELNIKNPDDKINEIGYITKEISLNDNKKTDSETKPKDDIKNIHNEDSDSNHNTYTANKQNILEVLIGSPKTNKINKLQHVTKAKIEVSNKIDKVKKENADISNNDRLSDQAHANKLVSDSGNGIESDTISNLMYDFKSKTKISVNNDLELEAPYLILMILIIFIVLYLIKQLCFRRKYKLSLLL